MRVGDHKHFEDLFGGFKVFHFINFWYSKNNYRENVPTIFIGKRLFLEPEYASKISLNSHVKSTEEIKCIGENFNVTKNLQIDLGVKISYKTHSLFFEFYTGKKGYLDCFFFHS